MTTATPATPPPEATTAKEAIDYFLGAAVAGDEPRMVRYLQARRVMGELFADNPPTAYAEGPSSAEAAPGCSSVKLVYPAGKRLGVGLRDDVLVCGERDGAGAFKVGAITTYRAYQDREAQGKLIGKNAGVITIQLDGPLPGPGATGELSRRIDASVPFLGGGFIGIATVRVQKVDGKRVTMDLVEEESKMTVNGGKLNHFTPGVDIRLKWSEAE